mgnify:CR=1 FL=1
MRGWRILLVSLLALLAVIIALPFALDTQSGRDWTARRLAGFSLAEADLLRRADAIFIDELRAADWYDKTSQAFAVFLPVKSVGVVGDARAYEWVIALRRAGQFSGEDAVSPERAEPPEARKNKRTPHPPSTATGPVGARTHFGDCAPRACLIESFHASLSCLLAPLGADHLPSRRRRARLPLGRPP